MNHHDIGEQNIERLLTAAYQPEGVDPEFSQSLQEYLCGMAVEIAAKRPAQPASAEQVKYRKLRRRLGWVMAAAACLAIVALVLYAENRRREPFELSTMAGLPPAVSYGPGQSGPGLTARARPAEKPLRPVAVGTSVATNAGERRRLTLDDGSVLFLNQDTEATVAASRRLVLKKGEIYVEVSPRERSDKSADDSSFSAHAPFVVTTPTREVAALGTHFAVKAAPSGTGVVVTQGKVKVSGIDKVISAGQEVKPGGAEVVPAPRASHVLDWMRPLLADEASLVPGSKYAGGALLALDPAGQEVQLSLRKYHIDVHIEDGYARTTIDQTYFNNEWSRLEGTFYFPLPADAVLSRLAMYVEDNGQCKLMEGGMAERDHARNVFETIRYTQRDPALLEWVDGTTFKMRVFPLEGRKEKRIILSYTQRLSPLYGSTRYRFPGGHNMALVRDWSFHALIRGGASQTIAAEPAMHISRDGGDAVVSAGARNIEPKQDVTLELSEKGTQFFSEQVRFSSVAHVGSEYLMVRYRPELRNQPKRQWRDWVILFETSANRNPLLARAQIEAVRYLLLNAEHDDTFVVMTAGTRVRLFDKNARPATRDNIAAAVKFLEQSHLIGGLDLDNALRTAAPFLHGAKNPHLVHIGAGIAALGEHRGEELVKRLPEGMRYVGIGVGKQWNRAFMKLAAERTGGYYRQINPDEPIAWHAFDLMATLNTPRLMNVRVVDEAEKATFLSESSTVAQGEEVGAIARMPRARNVNNVTGVVVAGTLDGKAWRRVLKVKDVAANAGYLPRAWAKLEIDRLVADGAEKNKAKIVELSKASYVMSPFTSLLVLETEADYQRFNVDRGRKDHWAMYMCPERIPIVFEPDTSGTSTPKNEAKRTVKDVLETIQVRVPPRFLYRPSEGNQGGRVTTTAWVNTSTYGAADMDVLRFGDLAGNATAIYPFWPRQRRVAGPEFYPLPNIDGELTAGETPVPPMLFNNFGPFIPGFLGSVGSRVGPNNQFLGGGLPNFAGGFGVMGGQGFGGMGMMGVGGGSMGMAGGFTGTNSPNGAMNYFWLPNGGGFSSGNFGSFNGVMMGDGSMPNLGWFAALPEIRQRIQSAPMVIGAPGPWVPNQTVVGLVTSADGKLLTTSRGIRLWDPWTELKGAASKALADAAIISRTMTLQGEKTAEMQGRRSNENSLISDIALEALLTVTLPGVSQRSLLYQRPTFTGDRRFFTDLTLYAPGLHTSDADIQAASQSEVRPAPVFRTGTIDPAAKALIDGARGAGWQSLTISGKDSFRITFNGSGQCVYEHILQNGLRERVVCNGKTLLHLYPEIGLGAKRPFSRFHRADLIKLVPWLLPPAAELVRGADVKMSDQWTIAIVPFPTKPAAKKTEMRVSLQTHLLFTADGRLQERRLVEMPLRKILYRETYAPDGTVAWFKGDDKKPTDEMKYTLAPAAAPDLKPDTSDLVVIPMPLRMAQAVLNEAPNFNNDYANLDADTAIALITAYAGTDDWQQALHVFGKRFHAKGDRRIGFYALLAGAGLTFQPKALYQWGDTRVTLDVEAEHPNNPLAKYLAKAISSPNAGNFGNVGGRETGFIQRLAAFHDLHDAWSNGRTGERDRAIRFIKDAPPAFAWALAVAMADRVAGDHDAVNALTAAFQRLAAAPGLGYAARYESARTLLSSGNAQKAREAFVKLYTETRDRGVVPPIEHTFRQALSTGGDSMRKLIQETAGDLIKKHRYAGALALAVQMRQLGESVFADEEISNVLAHAGTQHPLISLAAIRHLAESGQTARADALLQEMLKDEKLAKQPVLWRYGATLAQQRGLTGRAAACLETALDLEFPNLPPVVNVQAVREDYGTLLNQYHQLVLALTAVESTPPKNLPARIVRAADRWRALDPDSTAACQLAAKTLQLLGERDLAWEYLTTPVALKPNQATPWLDMAHHLQNDDVELADRAFDLAYQAEPTNAQVLWERAQHLQQFGRQTQARELYRRLAEGTWQPRFEVLKQQARQMLAN